MKLQMTEELKTKISKLVAVGALGLMDDVEKVARSFTDEEILLVKSLAKTYETIALLIEEAKED